jgi:hypothetical protein
LRPVTRITAELFKTLAAMRGMYIPLSSDAGALKTCGAGDGSRPAEFPPYLYPPEK